MAQRSEDGVVDANLRCFDHSNLFIGDASVMPDMAEKNLTLTVMALANRLAGWIPQQHRS
jgi:choline dehydrogenase-like flavoprotein